MDGFCKKCCLKSCKIPDGNLDSRIEVKTVLPEANKFSEMKQKMLVKWKLNGEAEFHKKCWEEILILMRETLIKDEARQAAQWIKSAKHLVAFTGAGISTSAGIGDYRGKAGKWTEEDQAVARATTSEEPAKKKSRTQEALEPKSEKQNETSDVSQNGDGLHRLSGIPVDGIAELHGNVFIEYCEKCGKKYERCSYVLDDESSQYYEELEDYGETKAKKRKYAAQCELCGLSHRTGRKCDVKGCRGNLRDTIINFRDNLEVEILGEAEEMCASCDVMLCLGTTLMVTPACDLVKNMTSRDKLIICNRRRGCRVFGDCDMFMREVMHNIYEPEDIAIWESDRKRRMDLYNKLRE
ncbi:SIR1-like protein [Mya arenaria]|uniref:protein acetyllysine N-acetyltransferase n=1 Tax=Mya arenaria TaxID=6604 RepID=A0ABY7FPQ8_MYAAR|nr:SIR1-like protein [Mya arenaria]